MIIIAHARYLVFQSQLGTSCINIQLLPIANQAAQLPHNCMLANLQAGTSVDLPAEVLPSL